ncbi:aminotransferase class I/II-fold pyridoxal phosphate-dependent enzyme [Lysobacter sp. SG-8]|uniref:Aminotransferase class I/II-fold pyridoxal phosphate-dependent enzyme n=1 Tax=Marilutibacter penaei TaxID=2759900 RepID=A0A7W3U690_9GAMM|nr:aminotransferase class I/II-fold pyridoxal phosphate-dependent enzyme [Lysobacter penaei]MBB1089450.1 aminotransferase class I/II-fold pyridoxal phosphate-dependent enzyme [Lysobacter penaei]
MQLDDATPDQLQALEARLAADHQAFVDRGLALDLTRGKPSAEQLTLSDALDGILQGDYRAGDGTDTRNYGGLDGLPEARRLGAALMGVDAGDVLVGGNSSLTLMYQAMLVAHRFGLAGPDSAWSRQGTVKVLCPVPGYDRHFTVCEQLGIEMVTVDMTAGGPDMDRVEALLAADPSIKAMWCVPKYSNPTGVVYSDATVERIAGLGRIAGEGFRVFWDNAYAVHDLRGFRPLASISEACARQGTQDSVLQFGSTSKITHAGSGVAFMAASALNLGGFKRFLNACTIGPDKVNQLRTVRLLPDRDALMAHMQRHAEVLAPRFKVVLDTLDAHFADSDLGRWERPDGGYFVSFDTRPGVASAAVALAAAAGVKLTPAGATFPHGHDPLDRNIRIAPSVPTLPELEVAMQVFVTCVKLASVRAALAG